METVPPNKDIIEITKMVVEQNATILEINSRLISMLTTTHWTCDDKEFNRVMSEEMERVEKF